MKADGFGYRGESKSEEKRWTLRVVSSLNALGHATGRFLSPGVSEHTSNAK